MGTFQTARARYLYVTSNCLACRHYPNCLILAMHERWQNTEDPEQRWALDQAIPRPENGHRYNGRCRMFAREVM